MNKGKHYRSDPVRVQSTPQGMEPNTGGKALLGALHFYTQGGHRHRSTNEEDIFFRKYRPEPNEIEIEMRKSKLIDESFKKGKRRAERLPST